MTKPSVLSPTALRCMAEALIIAAIGGIAFDHFGVPAGLISGSVVASAIAAVAGRPLAIDRKSTRLNSSHT